ncbi:MAG TPA: ATP-binding cassette domain-containing protein [Thermoanaerobaculia bacterium]|nr:ATP-binding cassette domain-containing protein [Thermoanaerobaculia bacterium]
MSIQLEALTKRYGDQEVVQEVSLEVAKGELVVLLGESGSGKSTLLRMVAGLTAMDGGRVLLHGRDVTFEPPQRREVGLVFQSYALFRAMTVAENVEFALKVRRVGSRERRQRREELLDLVGLGGLGGRLPRQLSGGQQQRVALARALAHRPEVLLLDEPFGALDVRTRAELRQALLDIQRELTLSTIFVTHDQEEAFALADRLAVMHNGRLLELGSPRDLYLQPRSERVATFLGGANLLIGEVTERGLRLGEAELPLAGEALSAGTRRVQVLFRPEDVTLGDPAGARPAGALGRARVERAVFLGATERLRLRLPPLPRVRALAPAAPFGSDSLVVEALRTLPESRRLPLSPGDEVWLGVKRVHPLPHPGLALVAASAGDEAGAAALELAGELGRRAGGRVTELMNQPLEEALRRHQDRQPVDLVVFGLAPGAGLDRVEELLEASPDHLLVVRGAAPLPERLLIGVAVGEPGKSDVLFAGRLARHLEAEARVLTFLPAGTEARLATRFVEASVRTLGRLGVPASGEVRPGEPAAELLAEQAASPGSWLVLGAPLPDLRGRIRLGRVVAELLARSTRPVLIVRNHTEDDR